MEAVAIHDNITGRIRRVQLTAETFEEERILRMIINGAASDGTLFQLTKGGETQGAFMLAATLDETEP